jgi:hypothetical protein
MTLVRSVLRHLWRSTHLILSFILTVNSSNIHTLEFCRAWYTFIYSWHNLSVNTNSCRLHIPDLSKYLLNRLFYAKKISDNLIDHRKMHLLLLNILSWKRVLKDSDTSPLFWKYVELPVTSWFCLTFSKNKSLDHGDWWMIGPEKVNQPTNTLQ